MTSFVIRIERRTDETLRSWAEIEQKSPGQIVAELVDRYAVQRFWREMHEDFTRLRVDPVAWKGYQAEATLWQSTSMDGLIDEEPYDSLAEADEIEKDATSRGW